MNHKILLWVFLSWMLVAVSNSSQADQETLPNAKTQYEMAIKEAHDDLLADLDKKMVSAKRRGSLEDFEVINTEKQQFLKTGELPISIRTTGYQSEVKRAVSELEREYQSVIEEAVKNAQIEDAKKYREELTAIKNDCARVLEPDQFALFKVRSGISDVSPLRLKATVYSNRKYTWSKIPSKFPFTQFTKIAGGGTEQMEYEVSRSGWLYICLGAEESETAELFLTNNSWESSETYLQTTTSGDKKLYLFRKWHQTGEYSLPRLNWSGPIIIFPVEDE